MMKVSVSTFSFNQKIVSGEITQLDTVRLAHELGFSAIEVCDIPKDKLDRREEYARELREECDKYGITVTNFVFHADLLNGCEASGCDPERELERVKGMIDYAALIGSPSVRHDALWSLGSFRSFDAALPVIAERAREIAEYGKERGIRTTVENHGYICQDPDRMERLYNAVDHDNFGILCDIGNFMVNDFDSARAVALVAPYTTYVHAKDFYFKSGSSVDTPGSGFLRTRAGNLLKGAPIGHGCVPVTACLGILKKAGYDGYVTVEYEGAEDCIKSLTIAKSNLERYIGSLN